MEEKIVVRTDLMSIVKSIGFKTIKNSKYGDRHVVDVVLTNDVAIEFADKNDLWSVLKMYEKCGETDVIKSKELVEELKTSEDGSVTGKYMCVKYTLKDGSENRLFASKFNGEKQINIFYDKFKEKNVKPNMKA